METTPAERGETTTATGWDNYSDPACMFPPTLTLTLTEATTYHRWRFIGDLNRLYSDEDIACFLINCYKGRLVSPSSLAKHKCLTCSSPLTLTCPRCTRGQQFPSMPGTEVSQQDGTVKLHRWQHKEREMCHLCGKTIKVRGFREHMLRHRGERQFPCPQCPKAFISPALLREHTIVHSTDKPYCCEVCGSCFRHRHTLKFHLHTHTGLKAYRCTQCQAAFTHPRGLSDHMRVHTGDKPYACQVCGCCFSSSGNLAAHRRKVHKLPPLLPSVPCRLLSA